MEKGGAKVTVWFPETTMTLDVNPKDFPIIDYPVIGIILRATCILCI
jgi:hypothetical protein